MVYLLNDDASGNPYAKPFVSQDTYTKLPASFWTGGWVVRLTGAALSMLLVLMDYYQSQQGGERFWIAPSRAAALYGLSKDTWAKGVAELRREGLVSVAKRPVNQSMFDWARTRNQYELHLERLADSLI